MTDNYLARTSPKSVFLQLAGVVSLYISAGSLISLLFDFVNYWLPDPLSPFFASDSIRWAVAALIIIFPAHVFVMRLLEREYAEDPSRLEGRLRKWFLYLTIFLAAVLLIGDLVALVYNFLGGDLTVRFLLKVLAIALVAGAVFIYELWDLRRRAPGLAPRARVFAWVVAVAILVSVVAAFFVVGSPFRQRLVRFDNQRVSDLSILQSQIVNYWQQKNKLPSSLDDLRDSISGFVPPRDPETGAPYEYRVTATLGFDLCAVFSTDSHANGSNAPVPQYFPAGGTPNWDHGTGHVCFSRTIDPELYGLKEKPVSPRPL